MADLAISGWTAATATNDTDEFIKNEGGTTKKVTALIMKAYFSGLTALNADYASNSTVTPAKITNLDRATGTGTFDFEYRIRYQAGATTTGIRFSVNHTGTVTFFLANVRWVDASATASTAAPSQAGVGAAGQCLGAFSARAVSTAGWSTTISVDSANADMLMIIEGKVLVTVTGNLELWHGSEVAAATTVKAGSSLFLSAPATLV